jgi:hypothetical protein
MGEGTSSECDYDVEPATQILSRIYDLLSKDNSACDAIIGGDIIGFVFPPGHHVRDAGPAGSQINLPHLVIEFLEQSAKTIPEATADHAAVLLAEMLQRNGREAVAAGSFFEPYGRAQTWEGPMQQALELIFGLQDQNHNTQGLLSTAGREAALRSLLKNENTREFALAQPTPVIEPSMQRAGGVFAPLDACAQQLDEIRKTIREFVSFNKLDLGLEGPLL